MDWSGCELVEGIPGKVSGVPIFKGSRVHADAVLENAKSGESVDDIAYDFDLNPENIRKVLADASSRQTVKRTG